jgi:hypothetical protein
MGIEDIADRLESIAEELDDLVIEQLRMATSFLATGDDVDPAVLKEERRIARASFGRQSRCDPASTRARVIVRCRAL